MPRAYEITTTRSQRKTLETLASRASAPAGLVRRARVILLSAAAMNSVDIAAVVELSREAVARIRRRFVEDGVAGLDDRPKAGRKDHAVAPATVERVVQLALSPPPAGRSRWTTRLLGREVGLTSGCISDILRTHGVKPHLTRTFKVSHDPQFAEKVTDVVGLYLHPPEHAVVLCVDEKVTFHYTPTSAAWLNQIEGFFGILAKQALSLTDFGSKRALRDHLVAYLRTWNRNPTPFEWTKPAKALIRSHKRMCDLISTAVH